MFRTLLLVLALAAVALSHPLNAHVGKSPARKQCNLSCNVYQRLDTESCKCVSLTVCDSRMRKRREFREVPAEERAAYVRAVHQLNKEGIWGEFSKIHTEGFGPIHSMGNFFPWHSAFLFLIESLVMEREPSIKGLPYFQWGAEPDVRKSTMWGPDFLGSAAPSGGPIPDGPFKNFTINGVGPVTRDFNEYGYIETSSAFDIDAVAANREGLPFWRDENVLDISDVFELFHSRFHFIVGGTMVTPQSPQDPVFHLHHAYVDKWWVKLWPEANGFSPTDAERMLEGLPVTNTLPSMGGLTFQGTIDLQKCVEYVEPTGVAERCAVENSVPAVDSTAFTLPEIEAVAMFEMKTVSQVKDLVSSIDRAVSMAPPENACDKKPRDHHYHHSHPSHYHHHSY